MSGINWMLENKDFLNNLVEKKTEYEYDEDSAADGAQRITPAEMDKGIPPSIDVGTSLDQFGFMSDDRHDCSSRAT